MSGIQQKFKLMKLYELLKQETDEDHPISRKLSFAVTVVCLLFVIALVGCSRQQNGGILPDASPATAEPVSTPISENTQSGGENVSPVPTEPVSTPIPEITESVHKSDADYRAYFTTHAVTAGDITVHVEDKLFTEEALFALAGSICSDIGTICGKMNAETLPVTVYVVEKTLNDKPVVGAQGMICSAEDVESGAYLEALCGVCCGTDAPWKRIGLMTYVFGEADGSGLAEYYRDEAHGAAASCAAVYFEPTVADAETVEAVKKTAVSITAFVLENYGADVFRALLDTADILPEWSAQLGLQSPPVLPEGHSEAVGMTAEQSPDCLCVLSIGNKTLFVQSGSFIGSADEIYRFVCFYFSGTKELIAHLKSVIHGTADIAEANLEKPLRIYLIPTDSVSNFGNEDSIYIASQDVVWHELVHNLLWVRQDKPDVWWEREAVACFLSDPVVTSTMPVIEQEYLAAYEQYRNEIVGYTEESERFFEKRLALYRYFKERDGLVNEEYLDDHAFMYSLGVLYMLLPDQERFTSTIGESSLIYLQTFINPNAEVVIGLPEEDSKGLTYAEALVLFEYLMETYGQETVMDGFINSRSLYSTFGKNYPDLYRDCLAYLQEEYGELMNSLE